MSYTRLVQSLIVGGAAFLMQSAEQKTRKIQEFGSLASEDCLDTWTGSAVKLLRCIQCLYRSHCSVYCVEFDSTKIITGSRDRSIKVWSTRTGRCLATFSGHRGSALCLKFELDFDLDAAHAISEDPSNEWHKGLLISGSSDCSVCVWDLYCHPARDNGEVTVTAEMRGILQGHAGGVLDLRIEKDWIISWSVGSSSLLNVMRAQSPAM